MSEVFDILGLPDDEMSHVLEFLGLKDMKNLRLVSKGLAEKLVRLDARMTCWKIRLWKHDQRAFKKAGEKGITSLSSFRVHFDDLDQEDDLDDDTFGAEYYEDYKLDCSQELVKMVSPWKDKIVGLDACASPELLSLHLPRLDKLKLVIFQANNKDSEQMIKKYADKLKELSVKTRRVVDDLVKIREASSNPPATATAPKLQILQTEIISPAYLDLGRNVTILVLGESVGHYFPKGQKMTPEQFKLPNLKELVLGPDCQVAHLLIQSNAEHLETLNFFCRPFMESRKLDLDPALVLPKLTTYVHFDMDSPVVPQILKASSMSLKRLVFCQKFEEEEEDSDDEGQGENDAEIRLPMLTEFVTPLAPWSEKLMELNGNSLKLVVLELPQDESGSFSFFGGPPRGPPPAINYSVLKRLGKLELPSLMDLIVLDGLDIDDEDDYSDTEDESEDEEDDGEWRQAFFMIKRKILGTRSDMKMQLDVCLPRTEVTFQERKLCWMREKGDTPYIIDYLKEHGIQRGFF
eukprot:TRINITY_DN13092_c0_g1_i3.p1 TRINITY_DN13092_c0_g1~~TRINITY_DN13092_c0_g1_i3.p1  ORF type:complete len:530 (-),score=141.00 TRINITY_DN13092_c0_g1_i3:368-1927(-)